MTAGNFPRVVLVEHTEFLDRPLDGLTAQGIRFCVLGEQAATPTSLIRGVNYIVMPDMFWVCPLPASCGEGKLTACRTL